MVAVPVLAQSSTKTTSSIDLDHAPNTSQAGCPVAFRDVSLESKAHLMPVQLGQPQDGSLSFQYKNQSGKTIQTIAVQVQLRVKKSVYDLDATTISLDMMLTGNNAAENLPLAVRAYGLESVTLKQVTYTDGSTWTAGTKDRCAYQGNGGSLEIGQLK
jgi:hypothetical protein